MRRPFMLPVSRVSSHGANAAALFIARRGFFSATRVALACIGEGPSWDMLDERNKELEKDLCVARSVMARMNVLLQEAQRTGSLEIPVKLSAAIAAEMEAQREHRLEDHEAQIRAAENESATISKHKRMLLGYEKYKDNLSKGKKGNLSSDDWDMRLIKSVVREYGDVPKLKERQAELEKLLRDLKAVDTHSDAFLDRDAIVHDSRKP